MQPQQTAMLSAAAAALSPIVLSAKRQLRCGTCTAAVASLTIVQSVCPDFHLLAGMLPGQPSVYSKHMTVDIL